MKTKTSMSGKTAVDGNKCLNTDTDMSSDVSVDVNHVFDQLFTEYRILREELRVYEEFKRFVDRLMTRMRSLLSDSEVKTLDLLDSRLKTFLNTNDSERQSYIVCEVKSEESSDVIDNGLQPITKRGHTRRPKVANNYKRKKANNDSKPKLKPRKCRKPIVSERSKPAVNDMKSTAKNDWICDYEDCRQVFNSQLRLTRHQYAVHDLSASNRMLYACEWPGCGFTQINRWSYERHLVIHQAVRHHCPVAGCPKSYSTLWSLRQHSDSGHNDKSYQCTVEGCHKSYGSELILRNHIRVIHGPRDRKAVCDVAGCQFRTFNQNLLDRHKASLHSTDRPFKCTVEGCDKTYKAQVNLSAHVNTVHNTRDLILLRCRVTGCDQAFKWRQSLRRHMVSAHSSHTIGCDWPGCEYRTKFKEWLKKHSLVHTTVRDYPCPWPGCTQAFKSQRYVTDHLRVHQSDRKYGCHWPGCQYRCYSKANVNKHEYQVHKMSKDKPVPLQGRE